MEAFSESDFANNKETRISVYGYVFYFCGVPVAWKSKSMRSVVLSTTEAEYVAISEVVKEVKFIYQLLESMDVKVPLPIRVRVDNIGAICDRILTYGTLLDVLWQMYHAWITYGTVRRIA